MKIIGQKWFEVGFWGFLVVIVTSVNATSVLIEFDRRGLLVDLWEPFVWEYSSGIVLLALIPVVIGFDRRFPLTETAWRRSAAFHALFTVPVSLTHVAGMVAIRKLIYALFDRHYSFGSLPIELFYEYRKDLLDYFLVLGILYAYRFVRARTGGTASAPAGQSGTHSPAPNFTIRQGQEEFSIPVSDVRWIEAAGNYALLHTDENAFAIRGTMKELSEKLAGYGFMRCHRSAIVNLAEIASIRPTRHGDAKIGLKNGGTVRLGRQYRSVLEVERAPSF